mgnify:CR=1 FL=1
MTIKVMTTIEEGYYSNDTNSIVSSKLSQSTTLNTENSDATNNFVVPTYDYSLI